MTTKPTTFDDLPTDLRVLAKERARTERHALVRRFGWDDDEATRELAERLAVYWAVEVHDR